jgi:pSer/pThr/pTyr-binding forkhead associated (FHA) protein
MNTFKLHVEEGEQAGEDFALREGDNLLGRSREAQIRLRSADVSSLHARLLVQGQDVVIANISQYGTWVGERKLQGSESAHLKAGQLVRAGKNALRLQQDAPMPAESATGMQTVAPSLEKTVAVSQASVTSQTIVTRELRPASAKTTVGADKTVSVQADLSTTAAEDKDYEQIMRLKAEAADLQETGGEPSGDETHVQETGFAPPEEVERRLVAERKKGRQRLVLILGASILALTLLFLFVPRRMHEGKLEFDESYEIGEVPAPHGGYKILYPKNGTSVVQPSADGVVISTLLGHKHDVRLVITLQESFSDNWATQDGETSLQEWMKNHTDQTFGLAHGKFEGQQNGIWVWSVPYTRTNSEPVVGEARVFCHGRFLEAISAEVPASDQGRAEDMYRGCTYFEFPPGFETSYWAGQSLKAKQDAALLFSQIGQDLRREAPLTWAAIAKELMQVLSQSVAEKRPADEEQALRLLANLRQQQAQWYNSQRLLVINAELAANAKAVAAVAQRCQAVFCDQTDNRYFEVRKW